MILLLDDSYRAHAAGDAAGFEQAMDDAIELDPVCVNAIRGGMVIGEIPRPSTVEWAAYVAEAHGRLGGAL